jgi:hypothetical protein
MFKRICCVIHCMTTKLHTPIEGNRETEERRKERDPLGTRLARKGPMRRALDKFKNMFGATALAATLGTAALATTLVACGSSQNVVNTDAGQKDSMPEGGNPDTAADDRPQIPDSSPDTKTDSGNDVGVDGGVPDTIQTDAGPDSNPSDSGPDSSLGDVGVEGGTQTDAAPDAPKTWLGQYGYCREIAITGTFPAAYSQMVSLDSINFDYSHAKADLTDMAFMEGTCASPDTGVGALPEWAQTVNPSGTSIVWFKTSTANISNAALFYGNPSAVSTFDIGNTFALGDDFEASTIDTNKWLVTGAPAIASGKAVLNPGDSLRSTTVFSTGYAVGSYAIAGVGGGTDYIYGFYDPTSGQMAGLLGDASVNANDYVAKAYNGLAAKVLDTGVAGDALYHLFGVSRTRTGAMGAASYYIDGVNVANANQYVPTIDLPATVSTTTGAPAQYVEWVYVRVLVQPEPTCTVGSEELPP